MDGSGWSLPARGVWIEMEIVFSEKVFAIVTPREGSVD